MVVDDEARVGFQRQTAQQSAFLKHASGMRLLFAVLKNFYSAIEQCAGLFFHAAAERQTGVGKGIDIGISGKYAGHGRSLK